MKKTILCVGVSENLINVLKSNNFQVLYALDLRSAKAIIKIKKNFDLCVSDTHVVWCLMSDPNRRISAFGFLKKLKVPVIIYAKSFLKQNLSTLCLVNDLEISQENLFSGLANYYQGVVDRAKEILDE